MMHVVCQMIYSWRICVFIYRIPLCQCRWQTNCSGEGKQCTMQCQRLGSKKSTPFLVGVFYCLGKLPEVSCLLFVLTFNVLLCLPPPDFDPNLGMMTSIGPMNPMMPGMGMVPPPMDMPIIKEIIHCKTCTLFPPNPSKYHQILCNPLPPAPPLFVSFILTPNHPLGEVPQKELARPFFPMCVWCGRVEATLPF